MNCKEVMTANPVYCLPTDTVGEAARVMRREHVGPVPVTNDDRERQLIGIITDRDLTIKVVAELRDPNRTLVGDVMTWTTVACRESDDSTSALRAMEEHQVRCVPVIDNEGRLVGIISQADLAANYYAPWRIPEVVRMTSQAA